MASKTKARTSLHSNQGPPRKRTKLDEVSNKPNHNSNKSGQPSSFKTVDEIQAALGVHHPDSLAKALTIIRNQFSLKESELPISPSDSRLVMVQQWMGRAPGALDIFNLWEKADPKQSTLISHFVSVLSSVVTLLSCNYIYHALGTPIIKTLLTPQWTKKINSYVGGPHTDLLLSTLKLLNSITNFASGRERKNVLEAFPWEMKSLPRLLNMRRKGKSTEQVDILDKPDIRTLYMFFLLSFIDSDTSTQVKSTFLEQHRDALLAIFKGLHQDTYLVVRRVLEMSWSGLWSDPKIKRTVKIGLFGEITISHLLKLYNRAHAEDGDPEHIPADLVHHFLLAICTRPGQGICFKERGWYPPEVDGERTRVDDPDEDDSQSRPKGGRIYNKILANILKTLRANEDPRQQELTLKILTACPELVAGYWPGASLTLEPRLSSKWIANISLYGSIILLPLPTTSFLLPTTNDVPSTLSGSNVMYQPTPPPLSTIMENILPSVNTKNHFSKGLQSNNGLVQHCTALALSKCLIKYQQVCELFLKIADSLQEASSDVFRFLDDEGKEGQWRKRLKDMEKEVRKRVPDFQVVLAFSHHAEDGSNSGSKGESGKGKEKEIAGEKVTQKPNDTKKALLGEIAHRLLWLYQSCLPGMVVEARFDVGKLLGSFEAAWDATQKSVDDDDDEGRKSSYKLHDVERLHILRLLSASDQFSWSAKGGSSKHTNLYILLKTLALNRIPAISQVLVSLLEQKLSNSVLFQEDPDEPRLWLACLPRTQRAISGSEAPDGTLLADEVDSVVVFLDDCVQRCWKTPYRYIDELRAVSNTTQSDSTSHQTLSPLLMTVLEQLTIKVANKLLTPSDLLALSTFVRKLILKLSSQTEDLRFLRAYASKVDEALRMEKLFPNHSVVSQAIRREVDILLHGLKYEISPSPSSMDMSDDSVQKFLGDAEKVDLGTSSENAIAAFELVDWVRLVGKSLETADIRKVTSLVSRLHPPALVELSEHLHPSEKLLWDGMDVIANLDFVPSFEVLLLNTTPQDIVEILHQRTLAASVFTHSRSISHLKRVVRVVTHALVSSERQDRIVEGLLQLLGAVVEQISTSLAPEDCLAFKDFVLNRVTVLKGYFEGQNMNASICNVLRQILESAFDPQSEDDRRLTSEMSTYWINVSKTAARDGNEITEYAMAWIQYSPLSEIFALFDAISGLEYQYPTLLERILEALTKLKSVWSLDVELQKRLPQLLVLSNRLPDSHLANDLVEMALSSRLPVGHDGLASHGVQKSQLAHRWKQRHNHLAADIDLFSYLDGKVLTETTAKIVCHAIYNQGISRFSPAISTWLCSDASKIHPVEHLARVFHAYLDCTHCSSASLPEQDSHLWLAQVPRLVKASADDAITDESRYLSSACVRLLVTLIPSKRIEIVAKVVKEIKRLPISSISRELLAIGYHLSKSPLEDVHEVIDALVDHSLQWAVRMLPSGGDVDRQIVHDLTRLLKTVFAVKGHLAEPVLIAVVQDKLHDLAALRLLSALLPKANFKPLVVNRHLQGIVQNPVFFKLCSSSETNPVRTALIDVLHILFHLHPTNTCQPSHVEPLVRIYRGTVSTPDRKLLSIFQLFELQRKISTASLFSQWSTSLDTISSSAIEAFQNIDSISVLRTCLHFPHWRTYEEDFSTNQQSIGSRDMNVYDPVFLILLFAHVLTEDPPQSAFTWVQLFRTNVVGLLVMSLSAKDRRLRELAATQIAVLWKCLENADMQEKPHVFLILGLLRDALVPKPHEPPARLPSYSTLLLVHAMRGVFYPSNFIYPLTARFLLQRPRLDANDVPMLYNMLFSSGNHWKKDRTWIIRFLSDGMQSTADWKVFKRRHTWDLLASMFQSSENDSALRKGILEVLANVTSIYQAVNSLSLKSSLLTWIEMQLLNPKDEECNGWLMILENIIVMVDKEKMEKVTDGEWRACIGRCLFSLLTGCKSVSDIGMLHLVTRVLLRLCLLPGKRIPNIEELLTKVVQIMPEMVGDDLQLDEETKMEPQIPHTAFRLHEKESPNSARAWGEAIEGLWRVSMTLDNKTPAWNYLTARLLFWRSLQREESLIGEWARQEVVRALLDLEHR